MDFKSLTLNNTTTIPLDFLQIGSFPSGSVVKNLPAMQETWVQSLGWEDPLDKEMAAHSGILFWRIPWTEGPGVATVHWVTKELDMT